MSCAWLWIYAGLALMLLELVTPGFILCFFGMSAVTVGLFKFALGDTLTLTGQVAVFSVLSILYLVLLRRMLKRIFVGGKIETRTDFDHESLGRMGRVTEAIRPPLTGRMILGDAEWAASADTPIAAGTDVRVVAQDNLTMKVEAI